MDRCKFTVRNISGNRYNDRSLVLMDIGEHFYEKYEQVSYYWAFVVIDSV